MHSFMTLRSWRRTFSNMVRIFRHKMFNCFGANFISKNFSAIVAIFFCAAFESKPDFSMLFYRFFHKFCVIAKKYFLCFYWIRSQYLQLACLHHLNHRHRSFSFFSLDVSVAASCAAACSSDNESSLKAVIISVKRPSAFSTNSYWPKTVAMVPG